MFTSKRAWIVAAAGVGLLLAAGAAHGQVTVFQQGVSPGADYAGCKDTWISDNRYEQFRNNAGSQTLTCGDKRNILMRFDLSALAKGTKVNKAVLRIWDVGYPRKSRDGKFPSVLGVFRLTRDWHDDGTWNHHTRPERRKEREPNPAIEWKTAGGEMDTETDFGLPTKGLEAVDTLIDGPAGHVHELDVTKLVQKWVSGEWPNHGLALVIQGKGRPNVASSEWYVPSARPKLLVACGSATDVPALTPAPKEVKLDAVAATPDPAAKPQAEYSVVRVGWNPTCALRGDSADAYVKEAAEKYPGNWGWMNMCRVGGRAGDVSRAVMRFDLAGIPKGASIKQAKLHLTLTPYTNRQAASYRYGAYLLKASEGPGWKADEVTASQRRRGAPWGEGGVVAASAGEPVAIGKVISRRVRNRRTPEAMEFDLTGAVRAWVAGKAPNAGIVLDNRLEGGAYDFYSSRAYKPAQRPYLEITLSPGVDAKPAPIPEVATAPADTGWVEAMRKAHAKFKGKDGRCVLYGDSITYSMAFLGTASWAKEIPYKNVPAEAKADLDAVWAHADRAFWRRRDPSLGHLGQMKSDWFLANIDRWQKSLQPEAGVILFGTNDLGRLCPPDYTENMAAAISRMLADGTIPILTTVPPAAGRDRYMADYYTACSLLARHFHLPVIDFYAEIMRRRGDDWNGRLPQHLEKTRGPDGRVHGYEVLTPISGDGVHPSNPAKYRADFSEEALNNNGFVLRDYLTLRKYGEVIRKVIEPTAKNNQ